MALPNNYTSIKQAFSNTSPPNYIPVNNYADFTYDVYHYYNEYCASPRTTQNRRIMRNYNNNLDTIKQFNRNPFINSGKKFNFLYTNGASYMFVESNNSTDMYIRINSSWCHMGKFSKDVSCKKIEELIKNYAPRYVL